MTSEVEKKSFFQKPENITTILSFAAMGAVGIMFLDRILPVLNRVLDFALETTIKTIALGLILSVVTWVATSKEWHKLAWYVYQMAMRKLTEFFVTLDPIAIMHGFVKQLKGNLVEIRKGVGDLRGEVRKLEAKIRENSEQLNKSQGLAVQAQKRSAEGDRNMKMQFVLQARKAGRLEASGVTYQGLLNKVRGHVAVMEKVQEAAEFMIADIENTVEVETDKRNIIRASYRVMSAAKRIMAESSQREMFDMAMESVTKDYYDKLGEIEQFMEDSKHFISTMDLENGVFEAEALSKLEEWEGRSAKLLEGGTGTTKFRVLANHSDDEDALAVAAASSETSYADLFGKLDK